MSGTVALGNGGRVRHSVTLTVTLFTIVVAYCACALALDASLDISQYAHTSWKIRDGFTKGWVSSLAQTPDGYLWLGTEFGLYRFDGVRAVPWQPPIGQQIPSDTVYSLLVSKDGTLWIGTRNGLASWKDGNLTQYNETAELTVYSLAADRGGSVWAATEVLGRSPAQWRLCAAQRGVVKCYAEDVSPRGVDFVFEDSGGNLWAGGRSGLWKWGPEPRRHYGVSSFGAIEDEHGALVLGGHDGLMRFIEGKAEKYRLPGVDFPFSPIRLFRSSDGSLWVGTMERGLIHVHRGSADWFAMHDGLSGDQVFAIFEDREGSIWVSTSQGLDRFRDLAVPTISSNQGLADAGTWAALATNDGSVWIASARGVSRWKNHNVTIYASPHGPDLSSASQIQRSSAKKPQVVSGSGLSDAPQSLFEDSDSQVWVTTKKGIVRWDGTRFIPLNGVPGGEVYAIAQGVGKTAWVASAEEGLFRVPLKGPIEKTPWSHLGHTDVALALADDPSKEGLWIGFAQGGITYWKNGEVRASYTRVDGLGAGMVKQLRFGSRGTLWAATQGGFSRIKDGHITTLTTKNGLPCDSVLWSVEDDDHSVWLYMPCALVRITRSELDAWVTDPEYIVKNTVYDISDGVTLKAGIGGFGPRVSKSKDGRIWFAGPDGVSVLNPHHLAFNKTPPPVHIEQITADGRIYDPAQGLHLPARVQHIDIDYTALSLVAPEKNHFRIKLEGYDRDWRDIGNRRQAFYTNLPPRNYRFRVMASNNSGVWNEAGAFLEFSVLPAFYQTTWFRILCAFGFLTLLWSIYELRVQQMQRQFKIALDARVNERTRIARELHDTLLQNFHGLMFQFQAASNMMLRKPDEAKRSLDDAISETKKALHESRDAIQDLRSEPIAKGNLAEFLMSMSPELASSNSNEHRPVFDLIEEGERQALSSTVSKEICRIALEVLRNAYQHSHAQRIEAEIRYGDSMFRFRLRDDGKGIAPQVLKDGGKLGHWGLRGVRERADRIGAQLDLWSEPGGGTEVQLLVPASIAYEIRRDSYRAKLFRRMKRRA